MIASLTNRTRLDEVHVSLNSSRATLYPFESCFRLEQAREWGPCVLGIDQAVRGPLSSLGPVVFCGSIVPCIHEAELESQGIATCPASSLSGSDQERLTQMAQSDLYVAWLIKVISSEAADGARCSMGVLEHTTAASIIKGAIAAGIDIRGVRVTASCDVERFRQFLFEAFPMIEDIAVYPRSLSTATTTTTTYITNQNACGNTSNPYLSPCLPSSPIGASPSPLTVPPVICIAGVVAQSARDNVSRQLLYRQRQSPSPLSKSPLSKPVNTTPHSRRDRLTGSGSLINGPLFRTRSSSEENTRHIPRRCSAFTGSEYGDAHCGLVSEMSRSQTIPIEAYDFYDDDSSMEGLTSPKRIRVVPCSPPLPTVITCEDSLPCINHTATLSNVVGNTNLSSTTSTSTSTTSSDSFESPPFSSTSLFVSPPPFASSCSTASTSVPIYRPTLYGLTSPF